MLKYVLILLMLIAFMTSACVTHVHPVRHHPAKKVWVPGHYQPNGVWIRGHWRYR